MTADDREWMESAACRNTTIDMHPEDTAGVTLAKNVCIPVDGPPCPVLHQCRAWALDNHEQFGTWGGLSQRERTRIWKAERHRERHHEWSAA